MVRSVCFLLLLLVLAGCQDSQQSRQVSRFHPDGTVVDWEKVKLEKKIPTDTVVIHVSDDQNTSAMLLSDEQRDRWQKRFRTEYPNSPIERTVRSGQYQMIGGNLTEVFHVYHVLIHANGRREKLLDPKKVGWHTSDPDINCRSLAINIVGKYGGRWPDQRVIDTCGAVIKEWAKEYPIRSIIAHSEAQKGNDQCPGEWFTKYGGRDTIAKIAGLSLSR